jgi:hypothetical protein
VERIPAENQLKLDKTYEQQRDQVNKVIIPTVIDALDQDTFPVVEGIVYEILHKLHRHQREEYLMKKKPDLEQDEQKRRKHRNGRRSTVSDNLI